MLTKENLKLAGQLSIVLKDKDGAVKDTREVHNLVVNSGLAYIASRIVGQDKPAMTHMAVGSSTTPTNSMQTDLISTLGSRTSISSTTISGSYNEKVQYTAVFSPGVGTGGVVEAGVFNAEVGGDMLCRTVFPVINKQADDSMSITWTITVAVG